MVPSVPFNRSRPSITSSDSSRSLAGSLATVSGLLPRRGSALINVYLSVDVGWLTGDVIAGLTVGMVLVPQSMSYATVNRRVYLGSCN